MSEEVNRGRVAGMAWSPWESSLNGDRLDVCLGGKTKVGRILLISRAELSYLGVSNR